MNVDVQVDNSVVHLTINTGVAGCWVGGCSLCVWI